VSASTRRSCICFVISNGQPPAAIGSSPDGVTSGGQNFQISIAPNYPLAAQQIGAKHFYPSAKNCPATARSATVAPESALNSIVEHARQASPASAKPRVGFPCARCPRA